MSYAEITKYACDFKKGETVMRPIYSFLTAVKGKEFSYYQGEFACRLCDKPKRGNSFSLNQHLGRTHSPRSLRNKCHVCNSFLVETADGIRCGNGRCSYKV